MAMGRGRGRCAWNRFTHFVFDICKQTTKALCCLHIRKGMKCNLADNSAAPHNCRAPVERLRRAIHDRQVRVGS
jgi:hypothetical protein